MVALVVMALSIYPLSLRFWHLPANAQRTLAVLDSAYLGSMRARSCLLRTEAEPFSQFDQASCLHLSETKPNWLLIGDSHAADLWGALAQANPNVNLLQATATGCKPLIGSAGERQCTDLMSFLFTNFIPKHRLDAIVLSARWSSGELGRLRETGRFLKARAERVVVLGPRVEYKHDLPWILAAGIVQGDPAIADRLRLAKQKQTDRLFARHLRQDGIGYVSLYQAICPDGRCRVTDRNGLPLAFDYGHLTASGSAFVAEQIRKSGAL
jgi:hypothetical protein